MKSSSLRITGLTRLWLMGLLIGTGFIAPTAQAGPLGDLLRTRIEDFVRARADGPVTEISVPPLGTFELAGVDPGSVRIDLSTRQSGRQRKTLPISITLSDDKRVLKRGIVAVRVVTQRFVVVAARGLRRGTLIDQNDLRIERRDTISVPMAATSDTELLIGMETTRTISSGTAVRTDWVEQPAIIERGQRVRLVLRNSELHIEAIGLAMSKGAVGDIIRVVNADSRREVVGRVGADGAVHVSF